MKEKGEQKVIAMNLLFSQYALTFSLPSTEFRAANSKLNFVSFDLSMEGAVFKKDTSAAFIAR